MRTASDEIELTNTSDALLLEDNKSSKKCYSSEENIESGTAVIQV